MKRILSITLLVISVVLGTTLTAQTRGKLEVDVEYTGEDITQLTINCKYSLFVKECYTDMEPIIIEQE